MSWHKRGLIFRPSESEWMQTHAQVPTPLVGDGFIRVYFAARPNRRLSLTTYVDLEIDDPTNILRVNPNPILELGKPGTFDEHGIMPSCAIRDENRVLLFYSGWSRADSIPYNNSTGLAISEDGGASFKKISEGPILSKSQHDPYSATSPCVLKDGDDWHMWYCSGTGWLDVNGKFEQTYDIKYAHSSDGVCWRPHGQPSVPQHNQYEALTRPFVVKQPNGYDMWFCFRGSHDFRDGTDAYRIGYAHSDDLRDWHRADELAGIAPSEAGWDSKMIAYPSVVTTSSAMLMFYNGRDFGREGFGYAIWMDE